jgi:hypothetical protein
MLSNSDNGAKELLVLANFIAQILRAAYDEVNTDYAK